MAFPWLAAIPVIGDVLGGLFGGGDDDNEPIIIEQPEKTDYMPIVLATVGGLIALVIVTKVIR